MNYSEAVKYCESFSNNKSSLSLDNIKNVLNMLGNPENACKYIHVAGTNGKGSVVSYISEILKEAGYKTGKYISPHLSIINERISINGNHINNTDFSYYVQEVKNVLDNKKEIADHFTMFEVLTCAAFIYFKNNKCDICVLETGLGGRLDATNVIKKPLVTVITKIGFDHMSYLGNTIEEIAKEKAGIIKYDSVCIISPQSYDNVYKVFNSALDENQCIIKYVDDKQIKLIEKSIFHQKFNYSELNDLKVTLLGTHQLENAATAIETVKMLDAYGITVPSSAIYEGLYNTKWPCRMELVHNEPLTFIDGAHNLDGVKELIKFFGQSFDNKKITYIFGVMKDKNYTEMIKLIKANAKSVYAVNVNSSRALDSISLCSELNKQGINAQSFPTVNDAIDHSLNNADQDDVICIFGSLYLASDARDYIINKKHI